jgi:hypothetical protein
MRLLIPLLKLDSFFPEEMYLKGELLYDSSGIEKVNELYKGKALIMMNDDNRVEIRFNKDNIVDINCTCQDFKIKKVCPHIVAASLEVRKMADKLAKKSAALKPRTRRKKTNLFDQIILNLDKEELVGFMSSYAVKDKNFRLFFEAFFLNKLKNKNIESSYADLLDEVLPPSSDVEVKFSRQQISLLNDIAKDLLNQYKDEISLRRFTDAFNIIKHLINKLAYAYNRNSNENLAELLDRSHEYFYMLFDETLAPELKVKAYSFIYDMIVKSYYFYQKSNDLVHLFLSTNPINEDLLKFVEVLNEKIKILRDESAKKYFISFYIGIKKRLGILEQDWYEIYFKDLTDFMEIAHILLSEGYSSELEDLLKELYTVEKISKRLFLESQLRVSLSQNDCQRIGYLILDIYENTSDFRYLKRVKSCVPLFNKTILKKLTKIVESNAEEDDKLTWWILSKNFKNLIKHLTEKNDISLIQRYEKNILDEDPSELEKLYLQYIHEYLESHFGKSSVTVVKNLLFHLRQIDAKKIAFNIEKDLFDTFSARKRFLKDLMGI